MGSRFPKYRPYADFNTRFKELVALIDQKSLKRESTRRKPISIAPRCSITRRFKSRGRAHLWPNVQFAKQNVAKVAVIDSDSS